MKHVWVCHTPLFNEPCGLCHLCELKIETNMGFVLSNQAINRYRNKYLFEGYYKLLRKLNSILYKIIS